MTTTTLDIDNDINIDDGDTGKFYLFWCQQDPEDKTYGFASKFEDIGHVNRHDCVLKNKTKVLVLSDPAEAIHPRLGPILVSKVMSDHIMWVGTAALHLIEEK